MIRLFAGVSLYAASGAALRLVGFITFLWLARTLSVEEYASWALLYSLQTAITAFGLTGIVEAVIGLLPRHRADQTEARLYAAANGVFLLVVVATTLLAGSLFAGLTGGGTVSWVTLACVLASGAMLAFTTLQANTVRLEERHFASLYFNFIVPLAGFVAGGAVFLRSGTVLSYFAGVCAGLATFLLLAPVLRVGRYGVTFVADATRPILARLGPLAATTLFGWLGGYGTNCFIAFCFAPMEVAKFTFLFNVAAVMQLTATSMNQVWNPRFYRMMGRKPEAEIERENRGYFQFQGIALGLVGFLVMLCYPPALRLVGGQLAAYAPAKWELCLLLLGYVMLVPHWHSQIYLLGFDRGGSYMHAHIVSGLAGLAAQLALMWFLGPIGIYVGYVVAMMARSFCMWRAAGRHWPVRLAWQGMAGGSAALGLGLWAFGSLNLR